MIDNLNSIGIVSHPALSDFSVKQFEVMADVSEVTRGPLATAVSH